MTTLEKGWNLISHPLVNIVDKSTLSVIYEGDSRDWDEAVIEGWIAPHIIAWFEDTHYPSEQLVPFNGYWFHTSRDLTVEVRPHLPIGGAARLADNTWSLEIQATPTDGVSGGDFIQIGLTDEASNAFVYGEDEYDHPNPGVESYVDLYFNKSEWIGVTDYRGIMVESPYFSSDMRSSLDEVQAWDIDGNLHNVLGDIELTWSMNDIDREIHLLVAGETFNMSEVSSVVVSSLDDVTIVAGDLSAYLAPSDFALSAAYPNPFNHNVTIPLSINKAGRIYFILYDINGKVIKNSQNDFDTSGNVNIHWDGLAYDGRPVSAGPYFIKLSDNITSQTKKILYLK